MKKPNFFIVGAPKCATSSLAVYLGQHPDVFMATGEPHFFATDIDYGMPLNGETEYLKLFHQAGDAAMVGEKSTWYLYSKRAAKEIHNFNPEAKIIASIRNPVDMIKSWHQHIVYRSYNENLKDLKKALEAEPNRKRGKKIPARARFQQMLFYSEIARYSEQLKRYFDLFGRDNVLVILYDDIRKDPAGVYCLLTSFLGIDQNFCPDFKTYNKAVTARLPTLNQLLHSSAVLTLHKYLPKGTRGIVSRPKKALLRWNQIQDRPPQISAEARHKLQSLYRDEIHRLSTLIDRDVTHWLAEQEPGEKK